MIETRALLFTGGGTAGHVYPGLALAEEMARLDARVKVSWVGTRDRIEASAVPLAGYSIDFLDVRFLKGARGLEFARSLAVLPGAGIRALSILHRRRPIAVIGVGGYVAGPVCAAAVALGLPIFLLEQNARPGITNRVLARFARSVYVSFEATAAALDCGDVKVFGNPIRPGILAVERAVRPGDAVRLLVLGGSQGARVLNEGVPRLAGALAAAGIRLRVRHSCGSADVERIESVYRAAGVAAKVESFIDDIAAAYAATDLVISRSGATTISELTAIGLPAVFVHFARAADDHQTLNARSVVEAGAAVMLSEEQLRDRELALRALVPLLERPEVLAQMSAAARSLGKPAAGAKIAADILEQV